MWWHRYAVVEYGITAGTYTVISWHTTRTGALQSAHDIVTHFDATANITMLSSYEWRVLNAPTAAYLAHEYPATSRPPGIRYAA